MLAVPDVEAVNVLVQVAVPAVVLAVRLQVVNVPVTPETPSVSVPVGVLTVPPAVSVTVAVHVDPSLMRTGEGAQVTRVVVVLKLTVTIAAALWGLAL